MSERLRRALPAIVGAAVMATTAVVLRSELRAIDARRVAASIFDVPRDRLALALVLTAVNYAVLAGYDFLALRYAGQRLRRAQVALASFVSYAVANTVGFAMVSGTSVRYRFYTRWGVSADDLSRVVVFNVITFWSGLLLLGGVAFAAGPLPDIYGPFARAALRIIGVLLAAVCVWYIAVTLRRRRPIAIGAFELRVPPTATAVAQLAISSADWALAGAVLFVLLPSGHVPFLAFLGAFLAAMLLGLASHVPGGVGVFDGLLALLLRPYLASADLVPVLVVYRAVYYLLPLGVALVCLVADEILRHRAKAAWLSDSLGEIAERIMPRVFGALAFVTGLVLLFSGATPSVPGRLARLEALLPLGVISASHFLGSIAGALLLLLSQGLARRLDSAFYVTCAALSVGIAASILKGLDVEEALVLAALLAVLVPARGAFCRRAGFFDTRFSPGWISAVVGSVGAAAWLASFAFTHAQYARESWWQFELAGEASRAARGSVGASLVVLLFGVARVFRHAPHQPAAPDANALETAARVIEAQSDTAPYLVYLRDKGLIFNEDRTGFVMYGVQGRSWVALRDPVGPPDRARDLIRLFLERCDDFGGTPVFYEVAERYLPCYLEFGLTFVKLGEEARVDLCRLTLSGGRGARYRQALRRLEKDRLEFQIIEPERISGLSRELRAVSDDWLTAKPGREKGFSLGFFDPDYVARFPLAVLRREGRIEAFATIWAGPDGRELSVDLMRYRSEAPDSAMETLLVSLMKWGKDRGFRWFVLGMAPLAGLDRSPAASLWDRLGAFLYRHGETVYNFQGLRTFKQKFDPVWEPRYLVYPGGITLPRVAADVVALIAGGYRGILRV